jgi:transposase
MDVIFERCAGLDVHKKTVVASRIRPGDRGSLDRARQTFGTTTGELLKLLDWLQEWECTHVAMESTGEYWKPVYNILEGHLQVWLVNARHLKTVPGRKTDQKDADWLLEVLRHGLIRPSFVPPRPQRELRDLTRQRSNLIRERASVINRLQKVLEDANLKLASVVSDIHGVSAQTMLHELVDDHTDPKQLAELARGALRRKRAELEAALTGRVRAHHRFLLAQHLVHLDFLDEQVDQFSQAIERHIQQAMPAEPWQADEAHPTAPLMPSQAIELLDSIPGVNQRSAEVLVAEIGTDMTRFPTPKHLAAWAGVAPGNNESAGKQHSSKISPGERPVRKGLVQAAHAAAHKKDCYPQALYQRLTTRRGKKRAVIAVAHSLAVSIWYMLTRHEPYHDLGPNYFDERKRESVVNHLTHRLEKLGYAVILEANPSSA